MKKIIIGMMLLIPLISIAQDDCKVPTYLDQISSFDLTACQYSEYNEYEFVYNDLKDNEVRMKKSGNYYRLKYDKRDDDIKNVSGAYIRLNYYNAVIKAKGENLGINKDFFRFRHDSKTVYLLIQNAVDADEQGFIIHIIEEVYMTQEIELDLKDALAKDGKIPLYGIFFDIDKSVIKPESDKELTKLVTYLKENPTINIFVVGHTDNTGDLTHNMKLSKDRAIAVVNYIVAKGISQSRLTADGVGPLCPVTSNKAEDGRKKNRRVEIVLK
ncbi:MAG: OmpA family protein [Chitinophagales bacterium]|nr:OmpA family protein [Chitinophagales bacterium]